MAEKRKPGDFANYNGPDAEGQFTCKTCGDYIRSVTVSHSVHFAEFSAPTGGGEVRTTEEPYCPNCEERPSPYGAPIKESLHG